MLLVDQDALFRNDLSGRINLFTGAGFSTLASNINGERLPVGDELKNILVKEFSLQAYDSLDLASIYAVLISDRKEKIRYFLQKTFTVADSDPLYDALRSIDIPFLYTTNIDDLFFRIFDARENSDARIIHDNYSFGAPRQPDRVCQYISLHGCVRHPDDDFLFTPGQLSSAFASDRETWYVFQRELQSRPTIFVGYGMRDAGVLQSIHGANNKSSFNRWILLRKEDAGSRALYESLGFHICVGSTEEFLQYILALNRIDSSAVQSHRRAFGYVPSVAEVAQRPVKSFFAGAEPEWSDAYSNQIVRRRVNSAVKNSILSGNHVAVVGLPLSGKSTILKQVACELRDQRNVLYFDQISDIIARKIVVDNYGSPERPLIFVDNLIDSRDAILSIAQRVNAQIVCAEQSIYFDAVHIKSFGKPLDVISSSDVSAQDLQSIIESIPIDIRRWNISPTDELEPNVGQLGLFEAFRRHVLNEDLTKRFRLALAEFEAKSPEAFDVYIMACYVHFCRTIVSFDMIFMFLKSNLKDFAYVSRIVGQIKSFLSNVEIEDLDDQDYFSVRSGALARIALKECGDRAFRRVFSRFHEAIPTRVIVDYPVFRRYAYDNDLVRRAYPKLQDGLAFYKRLVNITDNAYDYQHGAIYLSRMKDFPEAFSWIDNALSKSRGRVYPIRNTHARILFEANFDVYKTSMKNRTAKDGIAESMNVLMHCIENDTRRSYHLLRFSDQTLQYANISDDEDALTWLHHAEERLDKIVIQARIEKSRESYNLRRYQELLNKVRAELKARGSQN